MSGLKFNEFEHSYTYDGKYVVNVTKVLSPLNDFSFIKPDVLETARQKGIAIHKMVELWSKNDLNVLALPTWMKPALAEWEKFVALAKFTIIASEQKVYHDTFKYAGTLDLKGMLNDNQEVIIDLKRSFAGGKTIGYQLAAYEEADRRGEGEVKRKRKRFALRLREDGHFKLQEYKDSSDFTNFLTCLNWHRLQEKHK